jgi:predicted patatin/cPLA2 family phospholipase
MNYFDACYASSAGVFNAAYFAANQIQEGIRIWCEHLPRGFWQPRSNNMRYLEEILRKIEPLNCQALQEAPQKVYAAVSNPATLRSELICLNQVEDLVEAMLPSAAMPFLTGAVKFQGTPYYDAGLISQPPLDHVNLVTHSETWVILNTPRGYRLNPTFWKTASMFAVHDSRVKQLLRNCPMYRNRTLELLESLPHLKVIRPEKVLPIGWRETAEMPIWHTFRLGEEAARRFAEKQS